MSALEITVIVLAILFVAGVVGWNIYKKATGKSNGCDCGYGCEGCHGCHGCAHHARPNQNRDEKSDN